MAYTAEAIEIITDDGTGIPVTYTNTAIGLASDGHFYLITDRFNIVSGDGKIITGDTTRATWYQSILSRDYGAFSISRSCDFVEAGNIESVSSFNFSICNTDLFWATLKANGVYLARRMVKYYRVTSSDLVTFNFELRWTGIIDDQPYSDLTQSIQCVDNSKEIFKSLPLTAINTGSFPNAPSNSVDKFIPIVIGRVPYSPMINVTGSGARTALCTISGVDYYSAGATAVTNGGAPTYTAYVRLYTLGKTFSAKDSRLVNKYLHVVSGGASQYRRIYNNGATTSLDETYVYIDPSLDGHVTGNLWTTLGNTSSDVWYYEVVDLSPSLILSNKEINTIKKLNNADYIYAYSNNAYENISELKNSSSLTNINSTGYPGFSINSAIESESALSALFPIVPSGIIKQAETGWTTSGAPAVNASCPNLFDLSDSTGYTLTKSYSVISNATLSFDLSLPDQKILKQYSKLYILVDFEHRITSGASSNISIYLTAQTLDIYGRPVTTDVTTETIHSGTVTSTAEDILLLPRSYYGLSDGVVTRFDDKKAVLDLSAILSTSKSNNAYNKIRVGFGFTFPSTVSTYSFDIKEIGIIGERSISITSESVFSSVIGENFGTQWDTARSTPKTPSSPVLLIGDAYEHLLRNYDTVFTVWKAGKVYIVGDKIKSTADNGNIFVCTVAGTSHASTEPTWNTTEGATYTDGTVTWKQFQRIPIDTATFDALKVQRADWFIGRAITEKKESIEYYKELCRQGFFISSIAANGKVKVKSWLDNETPSVSFDSTNIIQGSIGQVQYTPMRKVYNDFTVRYDYESGGDKFSKQLTITNVDKPSFPAQTELDSDGTVISFTGISIYKDFGGQYGLEITTTSAHGLSTGVVVSLSGNTEGINFTGIIANVTATNKLDMIAAFTPTSFTSSSGTLKWFTSKAYKWTKYAGGFRNYARAKDLWDACHASYLITKTVNKCPDELSNCKWFIDPYAKDPDGNYIWQTGGVLDLDVSDDHPAVYYLEKLVLWTSWQKKQISFEVADVSTYSTIEIGDPVYFTDAKATNAVQVLGWVHEKTQIPKSETMIERIKFGITTLPEGYDSSLESLVIDEQGATDIIDEVSGTDIYDESGA